MKKLAMLLLTTFSLAASAQQTKTHTEKTTSETDQSINDDGKTLILHINGVKNGQQFNYDKKFAVAGLTKAQKDAIVKKVTDSLGVYHRKTK